MSNEIFGIKISSVIESTIGSFLFWIILGAFSLLLSKWVRHFLKEHWPPIIALFVIGLFEIAIYVLSGGASMMWFSIAHLLLIGAIVAIWHWRNSGVWKLNFRLYPFNHLVGSWNLKFVNKGKTGMEQATIDHDGRYYINGVHRFTLVNLAYDIRTNHLSYDKLELDGKTRHREVIRMAYSSCIFLGNKEGDDKHTLRYERIRSGGNDEH